MLIYIYKESFNHIILTLYKLPNWLKIMFSNKKKSTNPIKAYKPKELMQNNVNATVYC